MSVSRSPLFIAAFVLGGLTLVVLVGIIGLIAAQPTSYEVVRTERVEAPPEAIWPHIADYRVFVQWSPWTDRDPDQESTFSEPSEGVGARYAWAGNADVGRGEMQTLTADPPRLMTQRLSFIEPFESTAEVAFELVPHGQATDVTWRMRGEHDLMGRAMSLVMSFDALIGPDFEEGLRRLRARVEAAEQQRETDRDQAERQAAQAEESPFNTTATSAGGLTIGGRATTVYHQHGGPPARLGGARFRVDNSAETPATLRVTRVEILHDRSCDAPPTTVIAEPVPAGLYAEALEMRQSASELVVAPGASLAVDVGFAVVEAAQVSCDAYAARVTVDVDGEPLTATAALKVVRRTEAR